MFVDGLEFVDALLVALSMCRFKAWLLLSSTLNASIQCVDFKFARRLRRLCELASKFDAMMKKIGWYWILGTEIGGWGVVLYHGTVVLYHGLLVISTAFFAAAFVVYK